MPDLLLEPLPVVAGALKGLLALYVALRLWGLIRPLISPGRSAGRPDPQSAQGGHAIPW